MADDQDGRTRLGSGKDQVAHGDHGLAVEPAGGLVEHEDAPGAAQAAGECRPLLLPAGERERVAVAQLQQAEALQDPVNVRL